MKKIYLIHGSLGSGKTTLLNEMLSNSFFKDSIVIENEFANFSIDDYLISTDVLEYQTKTISGGCICCSSGLDFINILDEVANNKDIKNIIIESTGVANSIDIIKQIVFTDDFENKYEFGLNIMLIDVLEDDIDKIVSSKRQDIMLSDLILPTKSDLVDADKVKKYLELVQHINGNVQVAINGNFNSEGYFDDNFKSKVVNKLTNNIDDLLNTVKHNINDEFYVLRIKNPKSDDEIKRLVDDMVSDSNMLIKRIKGFYVNSDNVSVVINGTKNNIKYRQVDTKFNESVIVVIGQNLNLSKYE